MKAGAVPRPVGPSRVSAISTIVVTELRRVARDRVGLFFMVVLPVVIIVIIGATFGSAPRNLPVAVLDDDGSAASAEVVASLGSSEAVSLAVADSEAQARQDVRTGALTAAVVIPSGFGATLTDGGTAEVVLLTDDIQNGQALAEVVQAATDEVGTRYAAERFVVTQVGVDGAEAEAAVEQASSGLVSIDVVSTSVGEAPLEGNDNQYAYTAPSNLVMFVFINSLAVGGALIETRRLGVARRMLAAPVTVGTVLLGSGLARFVFALLQSALIVGVGRLLFGVEWGQTIAVAVLVMAFSLVGTGAGLLVGSIARNADQAQAAGIPVAIGLAMLGGCMWPLDVVSPTLQTIGHLTPHAWAMDAWVALVFEGRGIDAIVRELAVLLAYGVALLAISTMLLRRKLLSGN